MRDLVLNPQTRLAAGQFTKQSAQALLIEGVEGVGKGTLASHISAGLLRVNPDKLAAHPYVLRLDPEGNTISIDAIREARQFMRLRTAGSHSTRRVLIIERAERLTREAQNALLKLLEEPPTDSVIILTAVSSVILLPTIRSRLQLLHVKPIAKKDLSTHFEKQGFSADAIERAFHMSEGRPGLMNALLSGDNAHPLIGHINFAKQLLALPVFERLQKVDDIAKDKAGIVTFLQASALICYSALVQASNKQHIKQVKHWHHSLQAIALAERALAANAQPKLCLTNLMLSL